MIFEAGAWNNRESKWYFLPRRASNQTYDEKLDEQRAANILIKADEKFRSITYEKVGRLNRIRGYSSIKFVPGTEEQLILALKSEENNGSMSSYVTLFTVTGQILVDDLLVSNKYKFEGIEFI
jgi:soluble calcium-activated nucleotidase 1